MGVQQKKPIFNLSKKKILVVDDFSNFRLTVRSTLKSFGVPDIDDAVNGEDAIRKISVKKYDIILCDYNLGTGRNGQQVLEEVKYRKLIDYSTIFIMVTAENTMPMIMGALEYQPDEYLLKPFTRGILEKRLREHIEKKEIIKDVEHAVEQMDYSKAITLCDEIIGTKPRNLNDLLKLKGEILIKKTDYDAAADLYEDVLTKGFIPWAMLGNGKVKFITGNYREAKDIFEAIIAKNNKIMSAYDWLAKTLRKMKKLQEAQQTLMTATRISPKAILRQKALGNIAYANKDYSTARRSFKETVEQGKHSCFKSPSDYTGLAKTLVDMEVPEEGLGVLNDLRNEFPGSPEASLEVAVTEGLIYKKMDREDEAKKAVKTAMQLAGNISGPIPADVELDLAKACFLTGDEAKGTEIVRRIVQSNHDNDDLLDHAEGIFKDLQMEEKGREIVTLAKNEIIKLNNDGVNLVKKDDLAKAIEYFEKAAKNWPENRIINANAALSLILYMKKCGCNNYYLDNAQKYLNRVTDIDPSYNKLPDLLSMYRGLTQEN